MGNIKKPGKLYVTVGLPASGKSSWAKAQVKAADGKAVRVNKDLLRTMLHNDEHIKGVTPTQVALTRETLICYWLAKGLDVYCDDTNLVPAHFKQVVLAGWESGAEVIVQDFTNVSVQECIRRDEIRAGNPAEIAVGADVITSMAENLLNKQRMKVPAPIEQVVKVDGLESVVLCDLDGTLASMENRGPFDWLKVGNDLPRDAVISVAKAMIASGTKIVFLSGRSDVCYDLTRDWLVEHLGLVADNIELHMRSEKQEAGVKDSLVKYRLFNEHIRNKYNVSFVLDDRDQVVRLWRSLGLDCFQVAPGAF